MRKNIIVFSAIAVLMFAFTAFVPAVNACVCFCSNGNRVLPDPADFTACKTSCEGQQCPPGSGVTCQVDASQSTCAPPIPPGGGTPGGGGTDSACTKEINGVVFPCDPLEVKTGPKDWIRNAVEIVLQLVGAGAFLLSIYGGGLILFARGDPKKVSEGRKVVVYAAIGLIVILLSYFMLNVIFSVIQEAITS